MVTALFCRMRVRAVSASCPRASAGRRAATTAVSRLIFLTNITRSSLISLNADDAAQGLNIRENEIRAWDASVECYLATVDPSNGQSKRFAADEIGELRLPGVQDLVLSDARILDQVAKERAVRLVAPG